MTEVKKYNYGDRIEIESLNINCAYSLKVGAETNDDCALCKQNLLAPSFDNLQKGNLKVVITLGKCQHGFHKSCIDAYTEKQNLSCPIDKTPWNMLKTLTIADYIKRCA